jgi:2-methylisocitrate lyase-like PEP mutase family enzyme
LEEVAAVPKLVNGPCLFNNVWRGKSPDITFDDAQRMGYRVTIVPGLLFKAVIGICDTMLKQMKEMERHPRLDTDMTVRDAFRRVGADEWDAVSERVRAVRPSAKGVEAAE